MTFDLITEIDGRQTLRMTAAAETLTSGQFSQFDVVVQTQWLGRSPILVELSTNQNRVVPESIDPVSGDWTVTSLEASSLSVIPNEHFSGNSGLVTVTYGNEVETVEVFVNGVADEPTLITQNQMGLQAVPIDISTAITTALLDQDGSEVLTTNMTVTSGHTISDGVSSFTATSGNRVADVTDWDLTALTYQADDFGLFAVEVLSRSSDDDGLGGAPDIAQIEDVFDVTVLRDNDADGVPDINDPDDDNDGIPDIKEGIDDTDGDGIDDSRDADSDNDGIDDGQEVGVTGNDADGDGIDDLFDVDVTGGIDANADGVDDDVIGRDTDRDGISDSVDSDADGDGIPDIVEGSGDADGDGVANNLDTDSDNDGIPDMLDGAVDDDGDGIANYLDLDSDNDGIADLIEAGGSDINRDGRVDNFFDIDGDGIDDGVQALPLQLPDTDADGLRDYLDLDADNDGVSDTLETPNTELDANGDGLIDNTVDTNGDGWSDSAAGKGVLDTDEDGVPNYQDLDSDGDGFSDLLESGGVDTNADGVIDGWADVDGDGISDNVDADQLSATDVDGDGIADFADADFLTEDDSDGDGIVDRFDTDPFADGFARASNGEPLLGAVLPDTDGDGTPDMLQATAVTGRPDGFFRTGVSGGSMGPWGLMLLSVFGLLLVFRRWQALQP